MGKREKDKTKRCDSRSLNIDKLEQFIWSTFFINKGLFQHVSTYYGINSYDTPNYKDELKNAEETLVKLQTQRTNLVDAVKGGAMLHEDIKESMDKLRPSITEYEELVKRIESKLGNVQNEDYKELSQAHKYYTDMPFAERRKLVEKFIDHITIYYIDDHQPIEVQNKTTNQWVRYFVLEIKFKITGLSQRFTNGWSLNLNDWTEFKKGVEKNILTFPYNTADITDRPIVEMRPYRLVGNDRNKKVVTAYDTLVPYGNVEDWSEKQLIVHYRKERYIRYKAELIHKLYFDLDSL
jgi:hypothetical protein